MSEPRVCYYVPPSQDHKDGYHPSIVKENESGHYRTDFNWGPDLLVAQTLAKEVNAEMGLTPEDVTVIIASSMTAESQERQAQSVN